MAKHSVGERQKLLAASAPNDTSGMELVFDAFANAHRIKCRTAVDFFPRECGHRD